MRTISRRLRRIEERFAPQENEEVGRLVTLLRERRRRRLEASGEPLEVRRFEALTDDQNRPLSIADIVAAGVNSWRSRDSIFFSREPRPEARRPLPTRATTVLGLEGFLATITLGTRRSSRGPRGWAASPSNTSLKLQPACTRLRADI
jgi:hypothetical protein